MTIAIVDYGMGNLFSIYKPGPWGLTEDNKRARGTCCTRHGFLVEGLWRCMERLACFERPFSAREWGPIFAICMGFRCLEESEESPAARD